MPAIRPPHDNSQKNLAFGRNDGRAVMGMVPAYYSITPAASVANALSVAAAIAAGASAVLVAGTSVTARAMPDGTTRYVLDNPRNVTITSSGNDSGISFLVKGFDVYGAPMSERVIGANAGAAASRKAFASVVSVTPSGATAGTVAVGTGNAFGLPVVVDNPAKLVSLSWAGNLSRDAGTLAFADATAPAGVITGDVRGTYTPSSNPDGVKVLAGAILIDADFDGPAGSSLYGVTQA